MIQISGLFDLWLVSFLGTGAQAAFGYAQSIYLLPMSLLGTGVDNSQGKKGSGASAFTLAEISVRGIIQSKGQLLAMVQAPDDKTYVVHQGDKLADGVIKTVTPQGLVVIQDINDPLSVQKQREVRKLLRSLEDAKE